MAHPNEELVRRGYEAFNNADVETLPQLLGASQLAFESWTVMRGSAPPGCWPRATS